MPQDVSPPFAASSFDGSSFGGSPAGGSGDTMIDDIRSVLAECGGLAVDAGTLAVDDDLYAAGLTSHGCVGLMLGLEEQFDVEFPERLLNRRTFESIATIRDAMRGLTDGGAA
ncbi:acyl carrier protein [Azospirillum sp. HJ39]|uniref:acyl carrier protein n=1 Tax=Azospirillum sp. HJ39 TaxID=3159496 RepID=UPI0035583D60